jgi:hypothetical protein
MEGAMTEPWRGVISAAAVLTLVACQTGGPRDLSGMIMTFTEWTNISREKSGLQFDGDAQPVVVESQYRMRDGGTMIHERVRFAVGRGSPGSAAFMEAVIAGGVFSEQSTRNMESKTAAAERFERMLARSGTFDVKEGSNSNGRFLYAVVEAGIDKCLAAIQGIYQDPVGYVKSLPGRRYQAAVSIVYCDTKSEAELLGVFGTLRPKLS